MSIFSDITDKLLGSAGDGEGLQDDIQSANDQTPDEKKLAAFVREKIDNCRQANSRIALEGIYLTNVAYLLGFDGVYYDSTYRQFKNIDPKRKLSRNRIKVNKILPNIQNRLSRLTQSPPRYDVRPESTSQEDKDAAELSLLVIEDIFDKQHFEYKRQDLLMSTMQGGHAYIQTTWDPTLGKALIDPETEEFNGYEGDVRVEVLNCLEVFPDPLAKTLDDAGYVVKAKVRKLDYFKERYDRGHAVKEESAWLTSSIYDMKANALTSVGVAGASTDNQSKNSAIELVYYEKRSKEHPNGRKVVVASGVVLADDELPIGEFDIVKFDDILVGGRYNPEAIITHLRPIQDQYNITRTKTAEWIRKMLAGKYLAAKGSGLNQEAINTESGEVVEYNPVANALPPQPMNIPQIPSYVYKDLETQDSEFNQISGINEVSQGSLPSASIPAAGMAFLQEQDQTRIGVQTTRNEIGYAKVAQHVLKYVSKNYILPRTLKLAGDSLEYAVKDFVGADIANNTDVLVINGSTIPSSKVLRRQDILTAFNMGLLGNPADTRVRAKVLKMTEFGDVAEIWKSQALDEKQYKRVLDAIEKNDKPLVMSMLNEFDNQQYHLDAMNDYRKSEKFEGMQDDVKQLFMYVMEWRLQALVNITNPQLGQQQMLANQMINNIHNTPLPGSPGSPLQSPQAAMNGPVQSPIDQAGNPQAPPPQAPPPPQTIPQAGAPMAPQIQNIRRY